VIEDSSSQQQFKRADALATGIPYYVRALAMGLPAICFGLTIQPWLDLKRLVQTGGGDLRLLYTGAYMVRTGHGGLLYDFSAQKAFQDALVSVRAIPVPFTHPPYESLIFLPFSYLAYRAAFLAWLATNLLFLALTFFFLRRHLVKVGALWNWLPIGLFAGFIPLSVTLLQGQDSILLLLLLTMAFRFKIADCELLAGLIVGLGVFRFQITLPIAILFLLWRRWRFSTGFGLSSFACFLCSLWIAGINGIRDYWGLLRGMSSSLDQQREIVYGLPPGFMGNLRGLIYTVAQPFHTSSLAIHSVVIVASIAILVTVAYFGAKRDLGDQFLIAIIAASLTSYHFLSHDMSILLLPIIVLLSRHLSDERWLLVLTTVFTAPALDMIYRPWMFLAVFAIGALLGKLLLRGEPRSPQSGITNLEIPQAALASS
jgi:Glycosyltransferase family 87